MLDALTSMLQRLKGSRPSNLADDPGLENPLLPCPGTPNCASVSRRFAVSPHRLHLALNAALREAGARDVQESGAAGSSEGIDLRGVFRAGLFLDDVHARVAKAGKGSTAADGPSSALHLRSASRVGTGDLGVNRRRVRRILRCLEKELYYR